MDRQPAPFPLVPCTFQLVQILQFRGICWVQHTQEELFPPLNELLQINLSRRCSLAHFRLFWSCQIVLGGLLHQLHLDMEASDLRLEDQIEVSRRLANEADVLHRQFAAELESSSFK